MEVLYPRCAGLDVHKDTVVACVRLAAEGTVQTEVRTFDTTTPGLLALADWLNECGCTHVGMEATGVYWKPVWHVLSDGDMTLILANAAHVKHALGLSCPFSRVPDARFHPGSLFRFLPVMQACAVEGGH